MYVSRTIANARGGCFLSRATAHRGGIGQRNSPLCARPRRTPMGEIRHEQRRNGRILASGSDRSPCQCASDWRPDSAGHKKKPRYEKAPIVTAKIPRRGRFRARRRAAPPSFSPDFRRPAAGASLGAISSREGTPRGRGIPTFQKLAIGCPLRTTPFPRETDID